MFQKVWKSFFQCFQVFIIKVCFCYTAIIFQSTYSSYDNNCAWVQTCHTALDVQEFFCSKVSAESSLCNCVISKFHTHFCSCYRVTSMSNVCEWSAMNDCRNMFQCLNEVWFQGIFQKCSHCTFCMKIASCYRFLFGNFTICISDDDLGKSFFQVCNIACKAKDCHDLGCNCDVVSVFTRHTVCSSAKSVYYVTKLTVVHIHTSLPCDLSRVDVQSIALEDMVVDHCSKKVVCCTDGMEVTCEMKVDIFHRNYLCIAAACCTTFDTEYRSERWLTKSNHNTLSKLLHTICKTYCCCSLSFTSRCRVDCSYKNQFSIFFVTLFQEIVINFCFVFSVLFQIFVINTCFFRNLCDWQHFALLCNFDVTFESHNCLLSL